MAEFAVTVKNVTKEGQCLWVLSIAGKRLLLAHDDGSLHWHNMDQCKLALFSPPNAPRPVVVVSPQGEPEPQRGPKLVLPTSGGNGRGS